MFPCCPSELGSSQVWNDRRSQRQRLRLVNSRVEDGDVKVFTQYAIQKVPERLLTVTPERAGPRLKDAAIPVTSLTADSSTGQDRDTDQSPDAYMVPVPGAGVPSTTHWLIPLVQLGRCSPVHGVRDC